MLRQTSLRTLGSRKSVFFCFVFGFVSHCSTCAGAGGSASTISVHVVPAWHTSKYLYRPEAAAIIMPAKYYALHSWSFFKRCASGHLLHIPAEHVAGKRPLMHGSTLG